MRFGPGATKPENAKFWVKRDGTLHARDGEFSGTLSASRLSGNLTADPQSGGWLKGCGIDVNNGAFYVDPSGNVTMKGSINMADGSITWGSGNSRAWCCIAVLPPHLLPGHTTRIRPGEVPVGTSLSMTEISMLLIPTMAE